MPIHQLRDFHLYLHQPTVVMKARVNLPAGATYPITTIPFDTVSVGAYTDVAVDSFFVIGSADGLDDRGRGRVQNVLSATNLPVGRLSRGTHDGEIDVYDNDYITFYNDFRVHAKIPYDAPSGIDYKDSDVAVGDYLTTDMPPVANCGAGFADYIDSITSLITVAFDGTNSFAMADGATIASYAWNLQGGTVTVGTLSSSTLTATFPAGFRWVSLTVTDSNGTPHSARCPILAVNPAADVTIPFQVPAHRIEKMGQTIGFRLLDDRLRTTYPDGCLVMFWVDEPSAPSDRSHMWFIGWHQSDSFSIRATLIGLVRDTVLNCVDVAGRLAALPSFPQALQREAEDDVDIMWSLMPGLTLRRCLHYLAFWHSTALSLADFFLPDELDDYPSMRLDSSGGNLYEQINSRAQSAVPDYWLTCDRQGNLHVLPDWMLLDVADRPSSPAGTLTEDFWSDLRVDYTRPPRVHVLRSSAVVCSTDWLELGGEDTLPLAFCFAPGAAFGQGVSEATTGEKLTISQAALNACEGHRYARLNARYGLFSIVEPSGDIDTFQPALMNYVALNISAEKAAQRGLDFTTARGLSQSIDMRYTDTDHGTWISPTIQWEKEVVGLPAVTHIPEVPEDPDFEIPEPPPGTVPPDFGLIEGQQLVAGIGSDGYVYRTSDFQTVSGSGGPTWTRVDTTIADTIYSFVVDPFSPGYIDGAGAINGWIVNDTDIYRVTDLFGTVVATSVHTFPVATSGASFHWRSIQASFGAYFAEGVNPWLLCVSYYGDTAGHTGTWAKLSTDGGVTWAAEVQISALFDGEIPLRFSPIGVFTSPRTPGLAYTVAYESSIPAAYLPVWATWSEDPAGSLTVLGASQGALVHVLASEPAGGAPGTATDSDVLIVAPHPNSKRIRVTGTWWAHNTIDSGGGGSTASSITVKNPGTISETNSLSYTAPASSVGDHITSGSFYVEYTFPGFAGGDWPVNSASIISSPPGAATAACRIDPVAIANAGGGAVLMEIIVTMRIAEVELDDGTIYTATEVGGVVSTDWGASWVETPLIEPGQGQAGTIHFPWEDNPAETLAYFGHFDKTGNLEFRLKKSDAGVITDISPVDTAIAFGPSRFTFGIRAYDSDRQYLALAGIGNDTSDDPADDLVGLWVSSNAGAAWVNILAPVAASNAHLGLQIAFGGDDSDVLFAWGGWSNAGSLAAIYYSSNFGTLLDSREGNINSLGTVALIGIAGGPTP